MDEDGLPVDPGPHVDRRGRIDHPELVAVVGPGGKLPGIGRRGERLDRVGVRRQRVADPGARDHPSAAVGQQLPETRQVTQRAGHTAVGHRVPACIDRDLGVELRTHRLPELARHQVGQPRARGALHDPPQHIGQHRSIVEQPAVLGLVPQGREIRGDVVGQVASGLRPPLVDLLVDAHVGGEVVVVLVEAGAGAHVEQVPDGAALPGGAGQLRDVCGEQIVGREHAATDQHAADRRRHGLRHRHQQVRRRRRHAVGVSLGHDPAAVQHEQPVGVRLVEEPLEADAAPAELQLEPVEVTLGSRQRPRAIAAGDARRRDQVADVLEPPSVERRILPVRQGHETLGRVRRRPDHQTELCGGAGARRHRGTVPHRSTLSP